MARSPTNRSESTAGRPGARRFSPRIWHHDWHHLRELRRALAPEIRGLLASARDGPLRVLDLGAGDTPYRPIFDESTNLTYVSADIDAGSDLRISLAGRVPAEDAAFDLVVSFQVLEHVPDVEIYLAECLRVLCDDGRLLLSTHGTWLYHPHPTDFWRWTRDGLRLILERSGFKVDAIRGVVGPLAWTTQFRLFGYRSALLRLGAVGAALSAGLCVLMNARMALESRITPRSIVEENASVYVVRASKAPSRA